MHGKDGKEARLPANLGMHHAHACTQTHDTKVKNELFLIVFTMLNPTRSDKGYFLTIAYSN